MNRNWVTLVFRLFVVLSLSGCVYLSQDSRYKGPPQRPAELQKYYSVGSSYKSISEIFVRPFKRYTVRRVELTSDVGPVTIDYFQGRQKSDALVFVFPVLGGKNFIENYFADYLTSRGVDTAIVHRQNDFKDPRRVDELEDILRKTMIRDRIAMDFFEKQYGKKQFGSFGISRGAINASITAGVDPRLKYNVLVVGGTDLVGIFKESNQNRIEKYVDAVSKAKGFTRDQFFDYLKGQIKTDPKNFAQYLNAKDTLLVLAAFDRTVPFKYGMKLRRQIGNPRTIFLMADHYVSLLYTQIVKVFPPEPSMCVFPFDYVEGEALDFYRKKFGMERSWIHLLPLKMIQAPFNAIANVWQKLTHLKKHEVKELPLFEEAPFPVNSPVLQNASLQEVPSVK